MPVDYSKFDNIEDSDEEAATTTESTVTKKPAPAPKTLKCANCAATATKLKKCTVCGKVAYCSTRCQRDDWRFHKRVCAPPKKKKGDAGAEKKPAAAPSKPRAPKKPVVSSSDDDDDDAPITWYKHRETKLPDSHVVHTKLATAPAPAPGAPAPAAAAAKRPSGSVWNTAGTWEERDVLPFAKEAVEAALGRVGSRDFGSGVVALDAVRDVDGDASVGAIRGKVRHIVDLTVKIAFRVRLGGDDRAYKGTLVLKEYSADARTEPVDVEVKFTDAAKLARPSVQRVRDALGTAATVAPTDAPQTFAEDCLFALNTHFLPRLFEQS